MADALASALQWRLLVLWCLGSLVPTAIVAWPISRVLGALLDSSTRAAELARHFDLLALSDVGYALFLRRDLLAGVWVVASASALLCSPLLTGAIVAAARADEPLAWRDLLRGAVTEYTRLLRLLLVALLPLGSAAGLAGLAFSLAGKGAAMAVLESRAATYHYLAIAASAILLVLAHVTVEAARAQLAADESYSSTFKAWRDGVRLTVHRPLAVFGIYLGTKAIGAVIAVALLLVRVRIATATTATFWLGVLVTQIGIAAIGWARASCLFGLVSFLRR
jgi:hypothetical protein